MSTDARTKLSIGAGAVVCKSAELSGEITIGAGCVVHPRAIIRASNGPIHIGANNVVEEEALIENLDPDGAPMLIGDENSFEVRSVTQAREVGNHNCISVRARILPGAKISNGCMIGVRCEVPAENVLPERTVIYGENNERRVAIENLPSTVDDCEALRKLLPTYHKLHTPSA